MKIPTPKGYNDHDHHDHQKVVAFLEQTDDKGVKNGHKLSSRYDPADKDTWGFYALTGLGCTWSLGGLDGIYFVNFDMTGSLDVSGCTALKNLECDNNNLTSINVSGCTALKEICCNHNNLTELDVSRNTALEYLNCDSNKLTELDVRRNTALWVLSCGSNNLTELNVSRNTALWELGCAGNNLTELNLSRNTALEYLDCTDNNLTELDLSNTKLPIDHIYTEGKGCIGYAHCWYDGAKINVLYAYPQDGESFLGWYNEDGELLSTDAEWSINGRTEKVFIAKFTNKATFTEAH